MNDPLEFQTLTDEERATLVQWIETHITSGLTARSSYHLKHEFEHSHWYITNGQFKGAMQVVGYKPVVEEGPNWWYRVKLIRKT